MQLQLWQRTSFCKNWKSSVSWMIESILDPFQKDTHNLISSKPTLSVLHVHSMIRRYLKGWKRISCKSILRKRRKIPSSPANISYYIHQAKDALSPLTKWPIWQMLRQCLHAQYHQTSLRIRKGRLELRIGLDLLIDILGHHKY